MITICSEDGTANMRDAATELYALCRRRIKNFNKSEGDVKKELKKRRSENNRISYSAFHATFVAFVEEYLPKTLGNKQLATEGYSTRDFKSV